MPAVARKRQHSSAVDESRQDFRRAGSPPSAGSASPTGSATAQAPYADYSSTYYTTTTPVATAPVAPHDTLHHESSLEAKSRARQARRKARRTHQPLQFSWKVTVAGLVMLCELVGLLSLKGMSLSARNRAYKLDKEIAQTYGNVTSTQKEIAALDSSNRIAQWAHNRGWSVASQDKLDSVNNTTPVTDEAMTGAPAAAPAATSKLTKTSKHKSHKAAAVQVDVDVNSSDDVATPPAAQTAQTEVSSATGDAPQAMAASRDDALARHQAPNNDTNDGTASRHSGAHYSGTARATAGRDAVENSAITGDDAASDTPSDNSGGERASSQGAGEVR